MSLSSALNLNGKVALVTGSTKGIGLSIADRLAEYGAHVLLNGRNKEATALILEKLTDKGYSCEALSFDVGDSTAVKEAFNVIFKSFKRLDILVNNAGIMDDALIGMVSAQQVENTFSTNVFGTLYCSQYGARLMQRSGGSIINISSIIGSNGNSGQAVYGGSKAAIIGITKSLSKELAAKNIRVNSVAPGFIDTELTSSLPAEVTQERISSIKMNRVGNPEDIANVVLFLSSDMSTYITGQNIGVDGGMII